MAFTEIQRLGDLLDAAGIPYEYQNNNAEVQRLRDYLKESNNLSELPRMQRTLGLWEHYRIAVYNPALDPFVDDLGPNDGCLFSVIQGHGTYGSASDLLEMWEYETHDAPEGGLSAEECYKRICERLSIRGISE